ncbi:MAG: hypothetical protein KF739_08970 [Cryobacterium sp.]|nr:hypothetical protein [Micrococcales bacterium]MBX3078520.1 hypothetical protein [Cryobacterium sp.]MBX3310547.1 hypothetical protein [Cryobacterium sp.]MCB1280031.1 hypothetical protein [Salinibacterium sp.]HNP15284.1 hypothetical protein [Terrimesophilobacter sp.]
MYGALWEILPGPAWVKILILLVLLGVVLFCLVEWVFPWVNSILPSQEVTVDG